MSENIILKKENRKNNFTIIPNEILRDKDLSLRAKGLLCYMLSCDDDWKFSLAGMSSVLGETEYIISKALDELAEKGYHKKEVVREGGKIVEWKYYISDYPAFLNDSPSSPPKANKIKIDLEPKKEKPKKKDLHTQCMEVIDEVISDQEVRDAVAVFLDVRIRMGRMSAKSWRTIVNELYDLAKDKATALEIVNQATVRGYMKFYPANNNYSRGKPTKKFVDDVEPLPKDKEAILRDMFREEFMYADPDEKPKYEDWRKTHEMLVP